MDETGLQNVALQMGISLRDAQAWELLFHLDAVLRANTQMNLTAITDRAEGVRLHILDSLSALGPVSAAPEGALVDLGSGAGFPGIPLAIVSDRDTTLVESRSKKARFLTGVASALDHELDVVAARAEEVALERRERYSVATARAVASLAALVELASPLLSLGGRLVAMKGSPPEDELREGRVAAERVGLQELEVLHPVVPGVDAPRALVVYEKTHAASVDLPRRAGVAQKRPLT